MALAGRISLAAAALAATPALAQQGDYYPGPMHMWEYGGWWMLLGPLWMILVFAALIAAVVLLVRWLTGAGRHPPAPPPVNRPLEILKERFARGEIDKQEFEERRRMLE